MTMQYACGDVGPELTEHVGQRVAAHCPSILRSERSGGAVGTGVIRDGYSLGDPPTQDFRCIEAVISVVVRCDQDAGSRINSALPETALSLCKVTFILMKHGRQSKNDQIIPVGLVEI